MDNIQIAIVGILIPFLGTSLGAVLVFLLKDKLPSYIQKALVGFASGVMLAASIWSLLIPAISLAEEQGRCSWLVATIGFLLGIYGLLVIDKIVDKKLLRTKEKNFADNKISNSKMKNTMMMIIAVTIHNVPEGMAVGVICAGLLAGGVGITVASVLALSIGIAIQNIPEGAIISMPLKSKGISKLRSFGIGILSGVVEPIAAVLTVLLTEIALPILPYLLAFSAGAMIFVVFEELVPEMKEGKKSDIGITSLAIGFCIMMILDVMLG